jgi:hypothetical protein
MNKEFVKKIVKSEILRYEAFKEILPDSARKRVENLERDAGSLIRELGLEMMKGNVQTEDSEDKKAARKVNVEF